MPRQYEAIRDKFVAQGEPLAEAKTRAAKIYNAAHPGKPVTRSSDAERAQHAAKLAHALRGN